MYEYDPGQGLQRLSAWVTLKESRVRASQVSVVAYKIQYAFPALPVGIAYQKVNRTRKKCLVKIQSFMITCLCRFGRFLLEVAAGVDNLPRLDGSCSSALPTH